MDIKKHFPNQSTLQQKLRQQWGSYVSAVNASIGYKRDQLRQKRIHIIGGLIVLGGFFIIFHEDIFRVDTGTILFWVGVGFYLVAVIWLVRQILSFIKEYDTYTTELNQKLFTAVYSMFGIRIVHKSGSDQYARSYTIGALKRSELITERVDTYTVDDVVEGEFQGRALGVSEVNATRTEGSGKHKRTVTVFKGVFVVYELPADFDGVTFISTEGDKYGFGHKSFWSSILGNSKVEETELEWNQFEKDLHVATTDGVEARYILTPDLMQDLHTWWEDNKRNIRIVFRERHLYMLFPDKKIAVGSSTLSRRSDALLDYAMTIAEPVWHALLLLEDVRIRFR